MRRKWASFAICAAAILACRVVYSQSLSPELASKREVPRASHSPDGEQGLRLLATSHYAAAIPVLRRAVAQDPASWRYSLALAEALLELNHNFTALHFLQQVKSRFENLQRYRYTLGLAYYLCYQYRQAIREFELLPQADPAFSRIPFLIGNCYMAMGDLEQAEEYFRRAIDLEPGEAAYYVSLAKMLRMEGPQHLDQAAAVLRKALALNPLDVSAAVHLASCQVAKGEYKAAEVELLALVKQQPAYQPARLALADVYEHEREWAKARQQREIASRLSPPPPLRDPRLGPVASNLAAQ